MDEAALINNWLRFKEETFRRAASHFWRLKAPVTVSHIWRAARQRHISNFAGVHLSCLPAAELSFSSVAEWPGLSPDYVALVEKAIGHGITEGLLLHPSGSAYRGCSVILDRVEWDDVGSSEMAFYRSAIEAMHKLVADGQWDYVYPTMGTV